MNQMEKLKLLAAVDKAKQQIAANEDAISAALEALEKQETDKAKELAWTVLEKSDFVMDRLAALQIISLAEAGPDAIKAGLKDTYKCY